MVGHEDEKLNAARDEEMRAGNFKLSSSRAEIVLTHGTAKAPTPCLIFLVFDASNGTASETLGLTRTSNPGFFPLALPLACTVTLLLG